MAQFHTTTAYAKSHQLSTTSKPSELLNFAGIVEKDEMSFKEDVTDLFGTSKMDELQDLKQRLLKWQCGDSERMNLKEKTLKLLQQAWDYLDLEDREDILLDSYLAANFRVPERDDICQLCKEVVANLADQ